MAGGSILAAPLAVEAQEAGKTPRIGWLATSAPGPFDEAFRQGLRERGYIEGQNTTIEWRWVEGDFARLPTVAAELLGLKMDILVASGTPAVLAMQKLTTETPIVMVAGIDPVQARLVASLARPGANIIGLTRIAPELAAKRLELLKEAFPQISRVAFLWHNLSNPSTASLLKESRAAATALGLSIQLELRGAADLDSAFAAIAHQRAGAIVTIQDGFTNAQRTRIIALVTKSRLPGMYETRDWTDAGGLIAYWAGDSELYRRPAYFGDRILKGAKPGDLPIEQPMKFELVINLKTAKAWASRSRKHCAAGGRGNRVARCSTNAASSSVWLSGSPGSLARSMTAPSGLSAHGSTPGPASAKSQSAWAGKVSIFSSLATTPPSSRDSLDHHESSGHDMACFRGPA